MARAAQIKARPRYSDISNGPIAFAVRSYAMATTNAIVFPHSNAHQAQRSPRRKAVAARAIAGSENAALNVPYIRKSSLMYSAVLGDVCTSSDHEPLVKPS